MRNKYIILSFAFALSFSAWSQSGGGSPAPQELAFSGSALAPISKIEIYPNPAVDYIIVHITDIQLRNTTFELHSMIGTELPITVEDLGDGSFRIPVKEFASGYYFLVVKDEMTRFKEAYKILKN